MKKITIIIAVLTAILMASTACGEENSSSSDTSSITGTQEITVGSSVKTTAQITTSQMTAETTVTTTAVTVETKKLYAALPNICTSSYGYYQLNADEKAVYDQINKAATEFQTNVVLKRKLTKDSVKKVCNLLYLEENALYYLSKQYEYNVNPSTQVVSEVFLTYRYSKMTVEQFNQEVEEKISKIFSKITPSMTVIDKIKLFHDEIIFNCTYSTESEFGATPYGALISGEALCEGYARAFALLCNKAGIQNLFATGTSEEEEHMWNMVKIDGNWYNIDLTWDDPISDDPVQRIGPDYICYNYFLYQNDSFGVDMTLDNSLFWLPKTSSNQANYFNHYGLYATSYEQGKQILGQQIFHAIENHIKYVNLKFATPELYNEAVEKLFGANRELFEATVTPNDFAGNYFLHRSPELQIIQLEIMYA